MSYKKLKERRKIGEIIGRASQVSRVPGQPSLGTTVSGNGAIISPGLNPSNQIDAGGNSFRSCLTEVDQTEDASRRTR
ncbi:MAG: hypothetical protein KY445_04755 [Armatimonadetes bacterium]|nr:hypothetical protein [Armatimonadota bacterium]